MTYKRHFEAILLIMAALLMTLPALAAETSAPGYKANRLDDYLQTKFYKNKLFDTVTSLALGKFACTTPHFRIERKMLKVISPVTFEKKIFHPVKGIWFEVDDVIYCGKIAHVMTTLIAENDKEPAFASQLVQKDDFKGK